MTAHRAPSSASAIVRISLSPQTESRTGPASIGATMVVVDDAAHVRRGGWRHLPAVVISAACLAPLLFVVAGSLRRAGPPPRTPDVLPWPPEFSNYSAASDLASLPSKLGNSLVVAAVAVPVGLVVASAAGFGLARLPRRPRRIVTAVAIGAAMIPTTALLIGRFSLFRALGLTDTLVPLMAPALLGESPFHVLFYLWAFRRISPDVFDAARLEGMSEVAVYRRVAMPLVKPITLVVAVASFVHVWGAYAEPLVYLSDPNLFTVPMGVAMLAGLDPTNQPLLLAGAVMAMAPVIAVLVVVQSRFIGAARG
jgi:multiple sugar transport system permease protein